jgi:DNA (cytosine-5)-methyltransferase 1
VKYLSVCSGIEAATVAWHHMGWQPVGFSEIEKFPSQVLAHHYPDVPNLGDMTNYKEWNLGTVDLLVGGTPCQSFSVAGLRKGMADPRGNLALVYCGILDHFRPKWFVWENVPGVLSSGGGRDFGSFLGAVAELGYGFAYRVLDAQWFGVAQRRRRVFVVGCLGDWRSAAAVLFERQSLRRDTAPSREAGKETARGFVPSVAPTLDASDGNKWGCDQWVNQGKAILHPIALAENTIGRQPMNGGNGNGFTVGGPMYTLNATGVHGVAQPIPYGVSEQPDVGHCLRAGASKADKHESTTYVAQQMAVRRLTPTECERLQGFPDGYTDIQPGGKQTPDGPRYKALGNSMAVPVMRWIGERINNA